VPQNAQNIERTVKRIILLIVACGLLTSCGTIYSKGNNRWGAPYSGAECTGTIMVDAATSGASSWVFVPFLFADTVLSAAVDTVLLPADLAIKNPDHKRGCGPK
jgi:uncharacterized protein YceK